jgi:hypothetical protein
MELYLHSPTARCLAKHQEQLYLYLTTHLEPEREGPFGRPRHRWKYNIKMELKGIRCEIYLVQSAAAAPATLVNS